MMNIELDNDYEKMAAIKVLGVGGGGGNAVNRMNPIRHEQRGIYLGQYR